MSLTPASLPSSMRYDLAVWLSVRDLVCSTKQAMIGFVP